MDNENIMWIDGQTRKYFRLRYYTLSSECYFCWLFFFFVKKWNNSSKGRSNRYQARSTTLNFENLFVRAINQQCFTLLWTNFSNGPLNSTLRKYNSYSYLFDLTDSDNIVKSRLKNMVVLSLTCNDIFQYLFFFNKPPSAKECHRCWPNNNNKL